MKRYLVLLIIVLTLSGCTKPVTTTEAPAPVEEPIEVTLTIEEQQEVLKEYYNLLKENKTSEELVIYIDKNVEMLDPEIVDDIVISLEESLQSSNSSIRELSSILMKYHDYASDEIKSYVEIINREGQMMFSDGESIKIELKELLERAIASEEHIKNYPDGRKNSRIVEFYSAYIVGAIEGVGNQYIYANEGSSTIKQAVLDEYNEVIENNKESSTSKILQLYLEALTKDNNDMNGRNTLEFYQYLNNLIIDNI